ncbi:MAG TPA: VOC family protein [Steroidobacteraceae bacterium]
MSVPTPRRPAFISSVVYKDIRAAMQWLQSAFGFDASEVLYDSRDNIVHAEMSHGDGVIMISNEFADWARSPANLGGSNTQRIHVRIEQGIDEHCERARKAGVTIIAEPKEQFYGERNYAAVDPDGHRWTFSQPVRQVSFQEMEQATGFKFKKLT